MTHPAPPMKKHLSRPLRFFSGTRYGMRSLSLMATVVLIALNCGSRAQNGEAGAGPALDSINNLLRQDIHDTVRLYALLRGAQEYTDIDRTKAFDYTNRAFDLIDRFKRSEEPGALRWVGKFSGMAHSARGKINMEVGNYRIALDNFNTALEWDKRSGNRRHECVAAGEISTVHFHLGDYSTALKCGFDWLNLAEELSNRENTGYALNFIGNLYMYIGEFERAVEYLDKSAALCEERHDLRGLAAVLGNLGTVYYYQGAYDESIQYQLRSIAVFDSLGYLGEVATSLTNLGIVYHELEQPDQTIACFLKALGYEEQTGDKEGMAISNNNIGEFYLRQGDYPASIGYLEKSLEIARSIHSVREMRQVYENLRLYYEGVRDYRSATGMYRNYLLMKDSLINEERVQDIGRLEARYEMDKNERERVRREAELQALVTRQKQRKNNLQYTLAVVVIVMVFVSLIAATKMAAQTRFLEGLTFLAFLLFFEFCLVLLDPYLEGYSGGAPAYQLLFNAALAAVIFPVHAFFENKVKGMRLPRKPNPPQHAQA